MHFFFKFFMGKHFCFDESASAQNDSLFIPPSTMFSCYYLIQPDKAYNKGKRVHYSFHIELAVNQNTTGGLLFYLQTYS